MAPPRRPLRDNPRLILAGMLVLLAALVDIVALANRSAGLSPDFLTEFVLYGLWAADLTILLGLTFVLARNVIKLIVERRRALPFARFRGKLVAVLLGMTLVPAVLVLLVGSELIRNSTDRWFNAPMDEVLSSANRIAGDYYIGGKPVTNRLRLVRSSVWPQLDPLTGSTINLAREQFAAALASAAYQSDFWQQGGAPSLVLKTDQPITSTQAGTIKDDWMTARAATPGAPAVLPLGLQVQPLSADMGSEGAHTSSDKLGASIARYFKMPPGIVNVRSEAGPLTYSTVEQEGIHLVRYTIQPYCDVIGEALSSYLPGDYLLGDRIVLDPSRLTLADQGSRFNAWAVATGTGPGGVGVGWLTVDEVREREGLSPNAELTARVATLSEAPSV